MDQGGSVMEVGRDVAGTLRAEAHGHPPIVADKGERAVTAGFCTEHSAGSKGIGYEEEKSPTLRAGTVPAALKAEAGKYLFENHSQDTRYNGPLGVAQPVTANYGMGGNNQPFVVEKDTAEKPVTLKIRAGCSGGGKGPLLAEDKSATLGTHNDQTLFEPVGSPAGEAVEQTAFGISSFQSHAMLSDNPHAGIYEAATSRTLDAGGGNPSCNQGGICIVAGRKRPASYDVRFTSDGTRVKRGHVYETETARTLDTGGNAPDSNQGGVAVVEDGAAAGDNGVAARLF